MMRPERYVSFCVVVTTQHLSKRIILTSDEKVADPIYVQTTRTSFLSTHNSSYKAGKKENKTRDIRFPTEYYRRTLRYSIAPSFFLFFTDDKKAMPGYSTSNKQNKRPCITTALAWFLFASSIDATTIISNTTRIPEGILRYHYRNNSDYDDGQDTYRFRRTHSPCTYVAMIGVGTTMKVDEYDILAREMADQRPDLVVIFTDHAPGNPFKTNHKKYAALATAIAKHARSIIPICRDIANNPKFVIGGHSASGAAAIESIADYPVFGDFQPIGIFGLSPFRITDNTHVNNLPSMFWGFSKTTCAVTIGNAADKAYELSDPDSGRVLYQLQNTGGHPSHCIFADNGCPPVCSSPKTGEYKWVRSAVATSLSLFLDAIEKNLFTRRAMQILLPDTFMEHLKLFVNADEITASPEETLSVELRKLRM